MSIREDLIKAIKGLPEEAELTEDELKAIAKGEKEFAKGQYVRWRDIGTHFIEATCERV